MLHKNRQQGFCLLCSCKLWNFRSEELCITDRSSGKHYKRASPVMLQSMVEREITTNSREVTKNGNIEIVLPALSMAALKKVVK